ncbi:MAG: hypothetical protein KAG84_00130 [Bacteroidales bacterium]|nr:hypothetical protein [Bacteroidales bacterium]
MTTITTNQAILIIVFIVYIILTSYIYIRINKAIYLSEERRTIHKIFIWLLPFIGPFIIRGFWIKKSRQNLETMTKNKRKLDKSNFYESGKGIFGG